MLNDIVNIGVLGGSKFAIRSMIPTIQTMTDFFNLYGIASRKYDKSKELASQFNTIAFKDYDALIDDPSLDAIYIPLPNSLHKHWVERAMDNGIHVIVEKSLACNLKDVSMLCDLAKSKSVTLLENFQFRFHNQLATIMQLVEEGKIGELRCVRSSFGFPPFPDKDNIRYQKELGGGALLDAGAYPIKASQIFLGSDISVKAASLHYDAEKEVDIWGGAYLKQNDGPIFSEIAFGFDHHYQCSLELWGSSGKITANRIFTAPPGYAPEIILETNSGSKVITLAADDHFNNMLVHFSRLICGKEDREKEYTQNINQARLVNEVRDLADE